MGANGSQQHFMQSLPDRVKSIRGVIEAGRMNFRSPDQIVSAIGPEVDRIVSEGREYEGIFPIVSELLNLVGHLRSLAGGPASPSEAPGESL